METTFGKKCEILGNLWLGYRNDGEYYPFMEIYDVELPLAYILHKNITTITPQAEEMINNAWLAFLESIRLEDNDYQSLGEVMIVASELEDEE